MIETASKLQEMFTQLRNTPSDINEHFDVIKEYASKSESIVEMGVRDAVSTFALLAGKPKKMRCYDIQYGRNINIAIDCAKEIGCDFEFILKNVLEIEIEPTDLLMIDTLHTYSQLKRELELHPKNVRKYMLFHDTETFGHRNEWNTVCPKNGLQPALDEFLEKNTDWKVVAQYKNNNGMTVLERDRQ